MRKLPDQVVVAPHAYYILYAGGEAVVKPLPEVSVEPQSLEGDAMIVDRANIPSNDEDIARIDDRQVPVKIGGTQYFRHAIPCNLCRCPKLIFPKNPLTRSPRFM